MRKLKEKIKDLFALIKEKIVGLFRKLLTWYSSSKVSKSVVKVWNYIKIGLYYVFWPFIKLKKITYDKLRYDQQKVVISILFLLPVLIGFAVFFLYPLLMSLYYSFSTVQVTGDGVKAYLGGIGEKKDLLINYKYVLTQSVTFPTGLWETAYKTVIDVVVITIFSLLIAVMLNGEFKGRAFARAVFFLPVIFNSEAITTALSGVDAASSVLQGGSGELAKIFDMVAFFQNVGIPVKIVTFLSGITKSIYDTISYSGVQILIFLAAIQSVPAHLYEAAKIEGATKYESFWKITLPMVMPMALTVVVYTIVDSFLRSDINDVIQIEQTQTRFGNHAAMSWLYVLVSLLIMGLFLAALSKVVFYHDER